VGDADFVRGLSCGIVKHLPRQFILRAYEERDREAVRQICCETADAGDPMNDWFPDREIFADLLMRYYTDWEPLSSLVAVAEGRVVGYLMGCRNTRRFRWAMALWIVPLTLLKALARGTLWHPKVRALLWANRHVSLWRGRVSLDGYPAHLHINLRRNYRSLHIGQHLFDQWLFEAKRGGIRGIHVGVNAGNAGGCRFFEALGFCALGRQICLRLPGNEQPIETVIYGLQLGDN